MLVQTFNIKTQLHQQRSSISLKMISITCKMSSELFKWAKELPYFDVIFPRGTLKSPLSIQEGHRSDHWKLILFDIKFLSSE